jgi:hypothetical protein
MTRHAFITYPEDRYVGRPMVTVRKKIWIMRISNPYHHSPYKSSMAEIIRMPVKKRKLVRTGRFKWGFRYTTVWRRIPDDPRIPKEQIMEWARQSVDHINANLDADYAHVTKLFGVDRGEPWIVFDDDKIPLY